MGPWRAVHRRCSLFGGASAVGEILTFAVTGALGGAGEVRSAHRHLRDGLRTVYVFHPVDVERGFRRVPDRSGPGHARERVHRVVVPVVRGHRDLDRGGVGIVLVGRTEVDRADAVRVDQREAHEICGDRARRRGAHRDRGIPGRGTATAPVRENIRALAEIRVGVGLVGPRLVVAGLPGQTDVVVTSRDLGFIMLTTYVPLARPAKAYCPPLDVIAVASAAPARVTSTPSRPMPSTLTRPLMPDVRSSVPSNGTLTVTPARP